MNKVIKFGVNFLAVISIITVVILICFADNLFAVDSSGNVIKNTGNSVYISFETDPLILDGTDINLMDGVTATDSQGNDVIGLVNASVVNDNEDKAIMYSVNDSDYELETTKRGLQLTNYKGPSIAIKKTTYTCDINEINSYIKSLIEAKSIVAKDGYGNDISSSVYVDPYVQIKKPGKQNIELTVKNIFSDVAKRNISITITGSLNETKVTLSTETTTVKKGTMLDPARYIVNAVDEDGKDIKDQIVFDNQVDVNTPGRYNIYYYISGKDNEIPAATLTVVVTE